MTIYRKRFFRSESVSTLVLFALLATMSPSPSTQARAEDKVPFDCSGFLKPDGNVKSKSSGEIVIQESYPLSALVTSNLEQNLAFKHPFMVMSAFQRIRSLAWKFGMVQVLDSEIGGGTYELPRVFVEPMVVNGGRRIIGNPEAVRSFADYLEAGARGDSASRKIPMFIGPPGTGKTEFSDVINQTLAITSDSDPDFFQFTFQWDGLKTIPSLRDVANLSIERQSDGKVVENEIPKLPQMKDSPFCLLPRAYQSAIIQGVSGRVQQMAGWEPLGESELNPLDQWIREEILSHYAKKDKLAANELTPEKEIEYLSRHVQVVRIRIPFRKSVIDAQGRDIDWTGLFFQPNSILQLKYGSGHPAAYFLNGKVLQNHGGVTVWDEYLRNPKALHDMVLGISESRRVVRGGAPVVPLDTVPFAASNLESLIEIRKGSSGAMLDRMSELPVFLARNPLEIMKTILYMRDNNPALAKTSLKIEPVGTYKQEVGDKRVTIEDVVTLPKSKGQRPLGPHGRFLISVKGGYDDKGRALPPVQFSPHTLEYIANVVSATRMVVDTAEASEKLPGSAMIQSSYFVDVVQRLNVLWGKAVLPSAQEKELSVLLNLLKEGNDGITNRNASSTWLYNVIQEAARSNNSVATPGLAKKVLLKQLELGKMGAKGDAERLKWQAIADKIAKNILVPSIAEDFVLSMGRGIADINEMYDEVVRELASQSDQYHSKSGDLRKVDVVRMKEIERLYQMSQKQPLSPIEIMNYRLSLDADQAHTADDQRHPALLAAVSRYYADLAMRQIPFGQLYDAYRTRNGSPDAQARVADMISRLHEAFGYTEESAKDAFALLADAKDGTLFGSE